MGKPKEERLAAVHLEALQRFDRVYEAMHEERKLCAEDRRFYSIAGAQWEGAVGEQFENKPKFEVNKVHLAVLRIINEYRNNRITVDFVSKDGAKDDKLADVCDGLFRADEQDSCAEEAYDNAFEEAVGGGYGALRLRAVYEDEADPDNEEQRIRIEPIFDADSSVYFDLDAKRQDKADASYCFVIYSLSPEAYAEKYGDDPASWTKDAFGVEFDWCTPDVVYVAEYYVLEDKADEYLTFEDAVGNERRFKRSELAPEAEAELLATGYQLARRRRVKTSRVHKYVLSGNAVLEDAGEIAGSCIPVVPVYGKRWFVDNVERCMGHVRLAKDAQRLKNIQLSKLGEISAISSVEKPIFTPEQVAGHTTLWADDNLKNYPYLLVNPITNADGSVMPAGPIAYTKAPAIPDALAALLQITENDMRDLLGNPQEAEKVVSNVSGRVLELAKANLDMQTYIYVSNFAKAVRRVGEVWLSMARELYVEEGRTMKVLGSNDEIASVTIKAPAKDAETGALIGSADLERAKFDVAVSVGPSSLSRKEATVRALTNMLGVVQDPETAQVLQAMAMLNMEGEGISDVREYFRKKLVRMGALKPTDEEAQAMEAAASQPTPQDQALTAMAEESQAKATKARVETIATMADVELTKAKVVEILAGVDQAKVDQLLKLVDAASAEASPSASPLGA